jgi:hypothetical protein
VRPARILLIHQEESAFVCLWHLTALFDDFCRECQQEWHSCRCSDLKVPELAMTAADQARQADLVVFCQGDSVELPPEVKTWTEAWVSAKRDQQAALGWMIRRSRTGSGETEAYLGDMARRGRMTYLGMKDCSLVGKHPAHNPSELVASLAEPRTKGIQRNATRRHSKKHVQA